MSAPLIKSAGAACFVVTMLSSCGFGNDASGCSNFHPESGPMDVGDSTDYEVELVNGGWGVIDLAGWYWANVDPSPELPDGQYTSTATRTGESTLVITIKGQDPAAFVGPVSCE